MGTRPPRGRVSAAGIGTPLHHAWSRPRPPPVDRSPVGPGHPRQSALPSHDMGEPAYPLAKKPIAGLAHRYARPPFLVSALCGPRLHGPENATSTLPPKAQLLCPLIPPHARPPWTTIQDLRQTSADHRWRHAAPCSNGPPEIPQLGIHGCTLHARAQSMAAHGLPRSGGGVLGFILQSLSKFLGGL